jgi:hypothetical protein
MPLELVGQQIRYSKISKKEQYKRFVKFRIHDVGRPGYLQRLSAQDKKGEWHTIGWRINLKSYVSFYSVVDVIRSYIPEKYQKKAILLAEKWWLKQYGRLS